MTSITSAGPSANRANVPMQGKPQFSQRVYNAVLSVISESSEPLTAAEIHYSIGENFGVKIGYISLRQALSSLVKSGVLIRREETDRERQIRTTENRGPNSSYYGVAGYPIPLRTRGELPTDPKRNKAINDYHRRRSANSKAKAKSAQARPAKTTPVQTGNLSSLKERIEKLEAQNATLLAIIDKLLK